MKKTCYTLLIALASLVMVQAQDNDMSSNQPADATATAPNETNAVAAQPAEMPATTETVADSAGTNSTETPAAADDAMPKSAETATNSPEMSAGMDEASNAVVNAMATSATNESMPVSAETAAETAPPMTDTNAVESTTNAAAEVAAETVTETPDTNMVEGAENAAAEDTNAPAAPMPPSIPRIQFSDVPITTAIENLARLANINYMLDPKIGYGQPDANGQIKPEPTLSIRWENITAENALLALLDNYGLQLIRDKKTGIARVTIKDPTAPPPLFTKVVQLKYAGVSNIVEAVKSVLTDRRSKVLADTRTSQIVVVATDPEQQAVESLVNQLDKPTRQVLIETRLAEISSNPSTTKGIDWSGTLKNQQVEFGNNAVTVNSISTTSGSSSSGSGSSSSVNNISAIAGLVASPGILANTKGGFTPNTFFLNADGLSAVLSFLNSSADAKVISTPRIVTLDNETANINVTRTYPIFQVTAGTVNTSGGSSVTYSNVGTILHVTPRITANDYIWMNVVPEVSSFFGNFTATIGGVVFQAPQFDTRIVKTDVLVPNSNTLVIGGLVQDNPQANYTKVPLLGDIPGLGFLFKSENKSMSKDNLLIFITPTIVRDTDYQPAKSTFLKSKVPVFKESMDPSSAWDSAQPAGEWVDPDMETTK